MSTEQKRLRIMGFGDTKAERIRRLKEAMKTSEKNEPRIYRIRRFRFHGITTTIKANVTLSEAQAHCQREDTHGEGWFDGYEYMPGCAP